jgi:hypothetical protein
MLSEGSLEAWPLGPELNRLRVDRLHFYPHASSAQEPAAYDPRRYHRERNTCYAGQARVRKPAQVWGICRARQISATHETSHVMRRRQRFESPLRSRFACKPVKIESIRCSYRWLCQRHVSSKPTSRATVEGKKTVSPIGTANAQGCLLQWGG